MADEPTPDGAVDAPEVFDADKLADALLVKAGPQLTEMVTAAVDAQVKDLGLDKVDRKHAMFPGVEEDGEKAKVERQAAFLKAAIFGNHDDALASGAKALSEGSDAAGGYLVPVDFREEVIMRTNELSLLYPRCFRFPTIRDAVKIPNLATDVEISWDEAENEDFDESDAVFGQTTFSIHRANATTYTSRELANDSAPAVVTILMRLFAEAVSRERDKVIVKGNGSDQPEGIFSATGVTVVDSAIGDLTYCDLLTMDETVLDQYRADPSLCWITNQTVRRYIRCIKDSTGQPVMTQDPMREGRPIVLLDHPIFVNPNVPTGYIALGPLSKYWIADREQMGFESTTIGGTAWRRHQIGLKVWERWDGKLVWTTNCWVKSYGITGASALG